MIIAHPPAFAYKMFESISVRLDQWPSTPEKQVEAETREMISLFFSLLEQILRQNQQTPQGDRKSPEE